MVAYTKGARMPKAGRKKRRPTQKARAFRFGGVRPRNRQWAPPSLLAFGGVRPRNRQWALPLSWALGASDHAHTILAVPRTHLQTILAVPRTHLQNTAPSWYPQLWRNRHDEPPPQASARLAAALAWRWVQLGPRSMPGKEKSPGREERTPTRSFRAPGSDVRAPGQLRMHLRPQGAKMYIIARPAAGKPGSGAR